MIWTALQCRSNTTSTPSRATRPRTTCSSGAPASSPTSCARQAACTGRESASSRTRCCEPGPTGGATSPKTSSFRAILNQESANPRASGHGVMIYWHVEKKSLCVYSQLKSCSASEVSAMIEGVLRHCTEASIDRQTRLSCYMDTSCPACLTGTSMRPVVRGSGGPDPEVPVRVRQQLGEDGSYRVDLLNAAVNRALIPSSSSPASLAVRIQASMFFCRACSRSPTLLSVGLQHSVRVDGQPGDDVLDPPPTRSPGSGPLRRPITRHNKTATRIATEVGGTWSRYTPGDHSRSPAPRRGTRTRDS
jgi:hypothetical protein